MLKFITLLLFTICGWKVTGAIPAHITKTVVVSGPHTSNYDFIFAMAGFYKLKLPVNYLIKQSWADHFLLKGIFKNTGAIGIKREENRSMVEAIVKTIQNHQGNLHIMISPEGTRKLVHKWKTGFYQIAMKANIPLVLASLNYANKFAHIGPIIYPTGNYKKDMLSVRDYYKNIVPKYPDKFSLRIHD